MPKAKEEQQGKELLQRTSNGIEVSLLWHGKRRGKPTFTIVATLMGERKVNDGSWTLGTKSVEEALDMFHHPFSYALTNTGLISSEIFEKIPDIEYVEEEEEPDKDEGGVKQAEEDGA